MKKHFERNAHDIIASTESVRGCYVEIDGLWHGIKAVELVDRNNVLLVLDTGEKQIISSFKKYKFSYEFETPKAEAPVFKLYVGTDVPEHVRESMTRYVRPDDIIVIHDKRFANHISLLPKEDEGPFGADPLSFGVKQIPYFAPGYDYQQDDLLYINSLYYRCTKEHKSPTCMFSITDEYLAKYWKLA
ncbi:hypothetical protein CZP2022_106 [Vibrio phage C-ZP2022]|nr:hypothetical protein CZP2022_106 [Vibrio phage C-ZP2022]